MHRFIAIHGSAAHLALVSMAPLFLYPFFPLRGIAWVSFACLPLALMWLIMEPSVYRGEVLHTARERVVSSIAGDSFTWMLLALVGYAILVSFNGGVAYQYSAERLEWVVTAPFWAHLPGSVTSTGWLASAKLANLAVVVLAVCHAYGRKAGLSLLLSLALLSGLAGGAWLFLSAGKTASLPDGTVFGFGLLATAVAIDGVFRERYVMALPLLVVANCGNLIGLVAFSTPLVTTVMIVLWVGLSLWSLLRLRGKSVFFGGIGYPLLVFSSVAVSWVILSSLVGSVLTERIDACCSLDFFHEGYFELRSLLSGCASTTWLHSPWLGSGFGSFDYDLRQCLRPEEWARLPFGRLPDFNGWWRLLAEGGIVCAAVLALPVVTLALRTMRAVVAACKVDWRSLDSVTVAGPVALVVMLALPFFSQRALTVESLVFTMSLLAYSMRAATSLTGRE